MAVVAVSLISEAVMKRRPEIFMHQHAVSSLVTNSALFGLRTARMAGIAMAVLEAGRMWVGVVFRETSAMAGRAGYTVIRSILMARVAMGLFKSGAMWVRVRIQSGIVANAALITFRRSVVASLTMT